MQNRQTIRIEFTPEFKRNLRALSKKYHHIRSDIQPIIDQIQTGQFIGDRIAGTNYLIFKVRAINKDISKGKSSGYRIIYQIEKPNQVVLTAIYSKLDQSDISIDKICQILREYEK
jgi:mRNA-degrading endonuclease RelE of RelBE toxin-antitoxin system